MKTFAVAIFIIVLCLMAYVRYLESITVFHPSHELSATPRQRGLAFENVTLRTKDNFLINGWLIQHPRSASTMLYFHGNAGNMADRLDKILEFYNLGLNVFIIDYRGYGKSQGKPSEHGIYEDAVAAYDYLAARTGITRDKIWAYGASLGGAVAVDLSAKRHLACLIIDSSFSSAADMGKTIYPLIPSFLMQTKMDSAAKIKTITIPKLFFHSPEDRLVPISLGWKLYDAAPLPKKFIETSGGHNDHHAVSQDVWIQGIREFLKPLGLI